MSSSLSSLSRRKLFAGAGSAGALAAAVSLMPAVKSIAPMPTQSLPKPVRGGGYALTDHVKQYYKTAHV